jgi:hypothetical protein
MKRILGTLAFLLVLAGSVAAASLQSARPRSSGEACCDPCCDTQKNATKACPRTGGEQVSSSSCTKAE